MRHLGHMSLELQQATLGLFVRRLRRDPSRSGKPAGPLDSQAQNWCTIALPHLLAGGSQGQSDSKGENTGSTFWQKEQQNHIENGLDKGRRRIAAIFASCSPEPQLIAHPKFQCRLWLLLPPHNEEFSPPSSSPPGLDGTLLAQLTSLWHCCPVPVALSESQPMEDL